MARIFVIDDDPSTTEIIRFILEKHGHEVVAKNQGKEGIMELLQKDFDLIISDIEMPEWNGLEFREFLLKNQMGEIPFIFLTANEDKITKAKAWNLQIDSYLTKPVDQNELGAAVNSILNRKGIAIPKNKKEIFLKSGGDYIRIKLDSILYVQSLGDYIVIKTQKEKIKLLYSLKEIELELPKENFCRIHKSYLIRLDKIQTLRKSYVKIGEEEIPVGEKFKQELFERLHL